MRAILSVWDKTGLVDFARGLAELGTENFSTGGTKKALEEAGIAVRSVSEITGFPEILDGRVKTLHPAVHGGILAKRNQNSHMTQLAEKGIQPIDLVVVNLYPFLQTIAKKGVTLDEALENIDIGGPTMIRAAAKNFPDVIVVVDPADYGHLLAQLRRGEVDIDFQFAPRNFLEDELLVALGRLVFRFAQPLAHRLAVFLEQLLNPRLPRLRRQTVQFLDHLADLRASRRIRRTGLRCAEDHPSIGRRERGAETGATHCPTHCVLPFGRPVSRRHSRPRGDRSNSRPMP